MLKKLAPIALVAAVAACAPEIEARVYLQDVLEALDSGEAAITPALLRIPENTEDACKDGLEDLALKLAAITPLADEGECVEVDNNNFSQFTLDLPIAREGTTLDKDYLITLTATEVSGDMGPGVALSIKLSQTLTEVQDAIGRGEDDGFTMTAGEEEHPKFIFEFENDTRASASLLPNYIFVDDEPGLPLPEHAVSLDRRDSVTLVFADVVAAYVADANAYSFATVYPGDG